MRRHRALERDRRHLVETRVAAVRTQREAAPALAFEADELLPSQEVVERRPPARVHAQHPPTVGIEDDRSPGPQIGRAHALTPVTKEHIESRLLIVNKKPYT